MLVLSRKKGEQVVIDLTGLLARLGILAEAHAAGIDPIVRVMVVEIRGDKVRQGIVADRSIEVHREEVFDTIHRETA